MIKRSYQFIEKNNLKINLEYLDLLNSKGLLSFESLWNLKDSYFYYKKRYRTIEAYDLGGFKLYLKKYEFNLKEAENEWRNFSLLWEKGFPTLTPVVFGNKKDKVLIGTEELKFPSFLKLLSEKLISPEILLLKFSQFLALFHENNFFHQDCYIGHFHYDAKKDMFYIMDVARVKYNPKFKMRYLIKDLAQLKYSFMKTFKEQNLYWWDFFWKEYNKHRKEKLGKLIKFLINKKAQLIDRHTQKIIKKGGEGVVTYYKKS